MVINYDQLVDQLRDASLVAFLGAGVSATYTDPRSGKTWNGLPMAAELVARLTRRRRYIDPTLSFPQACFLLKQKEGRGELEKFLLEEIDKPVIPPAPAHVLLANLPFSCFVTMNYDQLLERALLEAKRRPHAVIDDDDVSRLRPTSIPVVKLHGSVSRPNTMVAAEDEYDPLSERRPIVDAYFKTQLANKSVLFLGFGLGDLDFRLAFNEIHQALGPRMPRSYAIVKTSDDYQQKYWESKGVQVITADLMEFLRGLLRASAETNESAVYHPGEDWINNAFFESLHRIRTLPSETQVIDAFLEHLLEEMQSPSLVLEDVLGRATKAAAVVLTRRPNLQALKRVSSDIIEFIRRECGTKEDAESAVARIIDDRSAVARGFAEKGRTYVQRGDNFLIFSQSVRVIQLLAGAPRGVQDTCHLYIAECRPKSPVPFQDSLSLCESLIDTGYEITVIPDAAVGNLVDRRQVTKVLMGAHAVFRRGNRFLYFVNTCGSRLILSAAREAKIPLYVAAESLKVELLKPGEDPPISFLEEEQLFGPVSTAISDLKASGMKLSGLNIGYDLCPFLKNVSLVTEK